MVTPDNSSIGVPIRKINYHHDDDSIKNVPPSRTDKGFKKYLDIDDHRRDSKVSKGPVKPDKDEEEASAAGTLEVSSEGEQSVMSLLASKTAGKMKKPLPDDSLKSNVNIDKNVDKDEGEDQVAFVEPAISKPKQSPLDLFNSNTKQKTVRDWDLDETIEAFVGKTKSVLEDDIDMKFSSEQSDLASINPFASTNTLNSTTVNATTDAPVPVDHSALIATIRELADRVVDSIYEMKQNGDTSTIVTIKNMPLFNDARIVLTTSSNASNEFNVAFENLRPDAKQLIDQNMNTLRIALDDNGYINAVHILTTTTLIEHALPGDNKDKNFARGDRENQEEQKRQQQEKNKG